MRREGWTGQARGSGMTVACKELGSIPCQSTQGMWSSATAIAAVGLY